MGRGSISLRSSTALSLSSPTKPLSQGASSQPVIRILILLFALIFLSQFASAALSISFVSPTDSNSSTINRTWSYVNVSVSDIYNTSAFIDWNRSLVAWWSFDSYNSTGVFDNSSYNDFCTFNGNMSSANITSGVTGCS